MSESHNEPLREPTALLEETKEIQSSEQTQQPKKRQVKRVIKQKGGGKDKKQDDQNKIVDKWPEITSAAEWNQREREKQIQEDLNKIKQ